MTELELYKFIQKNIIEISWRGKELISWIPFCSIKEFALMIKSYLGDGGMDVNLQESCIAIEMVDICEYYDIDPENICSNDDGVYVENRG